MLREQPLALARCGRGAGVRGSIVEDFAMYKYLTPSPTGLIHRLPSGEREIAVESRVMFSLIEGSREFL